MEIQNLFLLILIGIAAGFFNTVAGGGSLLTMPVLIFLGLPSAVANGTNRVALIFQNIIAVVNFRDKGFFNWKLSFSFALPAVVGAIIGSNIAISLPDYIFNKLLAIVMIVVLGIIMWNPKDRIDSKEIELNKKNKIIGIVAFFFVGIYGGVIQAGVGFIIIVTLTLITGFSLVRINSMKMFIVGVYLTSSLIVFLLNGKINWVYGLILATGNGIGAYLGSTLSIKKGDKWIKYILAVAVIGMSLKLLGVFSI